MNGIIRPCVAYITPHPQSILTALTYHVGRLDGSGEHGAQMLKVIDKLPPADVFSNLLSCDLPRARSAYTLIKTNYPTMFGPAAELCSDIVRILDYEIRNPVERQAMLELRDRLVKPSKDLCTIRARIDGALAAAERSMSALGGPRPGVYMRIRDAAFLLVALKLIAHSARHADCLLGRTPRRRTLLADAVRLAVVLLSVVGAVVLVARTAAVLGAHVGAAWGTNRTTWTGDIIA